MDTSFTNHGLNRLLLGYSVVGYNAEYLLQRVLYTTGIKYEVGEHSYSTLSEYKLVISKRVSVNALGKESNLIAVCDDFTAKDTSEYIDKTGLS